MPRWLRLCWLIGVALLYLFVNRAGDVLVGEYGEAVGHLIISGIWVALAGLSYFVVWLFAQSFLQQRD
jgi:hypothetical protein